MHNQKTAAAIHDISGLGKCSLTAALPVLSAAGVSVGVLPTAVLSTQTGGLNNYTYRDLTNDMLPIMDHWESIGVKFDAIYSGFLGSSEQTDIVLDFVSRFSHVNTIFICDPAMADNGRLYNTFDHTFVCHMKKLCEKADIIIPNITEATMLLDEEYIEPPHSKIWIESLLRRLSKRFKCGDIVLTGVELKASEIGAASYSAKTDEVRYSLRHREDGMFHSTGDLFASSLLGALLNGFNISDATEIAIDFTVSSIKQTVKDGGDSRFGLNFERCLPKYMKNLGVI